MGGNFMDWRAGKKFLDLTQRTRFLKVKFGKQNLSVSVQALSPVWLFATPQTAAYQASQSITNSWSLLTLISIKSVMPSNYLTLSSPSPPTFNPSRHQGLFQWVSSSHQVAKFLEFHFSISPSNEYSGLISFRIDWLDLLAVQGTLKSLLQHHSSKASVLRCSAFFIVQLSYPYMSTGKTIALTRRTFVDKVMPLLFNMLSRLVIAFLPRSKRLLNFISSDFGHLPKIKSVTVSIISPSICHEVIGPDAMILFFRMLSFKPTFSLSSFTFTKRHFGSSSLSAIRVVSSAYQDYWYFSQKSWLQLVLHPAWHFTWCTLPIS